MAVIEYSGLVSGMKGILGGSVLTHCKAGWTIKQNTNWNKKCSSVWQAQKAKLATLAQGWRALTSGQQASWDAATANFLFTDKYGNSYEGSGYQVYMSLNGSLVAAGITPLSSAPSPGSVIDIGSLSYAQGVGGSLDVSWVTALGANDAVLIYASRPVSAGSAYRQGNERLLLVQSTTSATTADITSEYIASYGNPVAGQKLWIRTQAVLETTGQHGNDYTASLVWS